MRDSLYSNQTAEREATRQQQATQLRRGMVDAIIDAEARRVRVRFANDEHVEATVTTAHVGDGWLPAVETPVLVDTDDGGTPLVVGSGTNVTVDDGTPAAVGERTIGHHLHQHHQSMTFDFAVTEDGTLTTNEFGTIQKVRGDDNVRQQIRLAAQAGVGRITGKALTEQRLREIRRDLRETLQDSSYVDTIVSIALRAPTDETLIVDVQTRSDDISLAFTV